MTDQLQFEARVVSGNARGRQLGVPTLNLDLQDVPSDVEDGVYACWATIDGQKFPATMHRGSRPTFGDTPSCEVHILDQTIAEAPETLEVTVVQRLRGIIKFPSAEELSVEMREDNRRARDILTS